jgi:ubiquinone/menaquinone biosynthesis C-methylase UbiE
VTLRDKLFEEISLEISKVVQQGRILDVGTGEGSLPIKIAQMNSRLDVYGVDPSEKAIGFARKKSLASGIPNPPRFEVMGVSSLSFEDCYFDLVVSTFSLHHWPDPITGLNEIYRILKPGGWAWIYDHWKDPTSFAKESLREEYGWLKSTFVLMHLKFVRDSLTMEKGELLIEDPSIKFQRKELKEHKIILLFKFQKAAD